MQRRSMTIAIALLAGSAGLAGLPRARAQTQRQEAGWASLFNGRDLTGWERVGDANWRIEEGAIVADRGNGFLVTPTPHANFELRIEFWADTATNSGIFIRATDPVTITSANAYEVNIWDERPEQKYGTGAIVDVAAVNPMPKAGGRWNVLEITARGDRFTVILNGEKTVDGVRDSKHATGRIALQHGAGVKDASGVVNDRGVIRFRKVELRTL